MKDDRLERMQQERTDRRRGPSDSRTVLPAGATTTTQSQLRDISACVCVT